MRVRESGASEGHLVIRWIGVEPAVMGNIAPRESVADFRMVSRHEIVAGYAETGIR